MGISESTIKAYENRRKEILYQIIRESISKQAKFIMQVEETCKIFDINVSMPNIGITLNNKLIEISKIFKKAEISMFAEPNEKLNMVNSNFVGEAIINDLVAQLAEGIQTLVEYDFSMKKVINKKTEQITALEKSGPIKRIFFSIRSLFNPNLILNLVSYSKEEVEEIKSHLSEYKKIDENLWEYNLEDNIVQSLANYINDRQYDDNTIPEVIEECIKPTLEKLGLENVIPQLKEELSKSREQLDSSKDKSWELSTSQKMEIQKSSKQIANEMDNNEKSEVYREDKEYLK